MIRGRLAIGSIPMVESLFAGAGGKGRLGSEEALFSCYPSQDTKRSGTSLSVAKGVFSQAATSFATLKDVPPAADKTRTRRVPAMPQPRSVRSSRFGDYCYRKRPVGIGIHDKLAYRNSLTT